MKASWVRASNTVIGFRILFVFILRFISHVSRIGQNASWFNQATASADNRQKFDQIINHGPERTQRT